MVDELLKLTMTNGPGSVSVGFCQLSRNVCLASTGIAFTIGILCGVLLPDYVLKSSQDLRFEAFRKENQQNRFTSVVKPVTWSSSLTQASAIVLNSRSIKTEEIRKLQEVPNHEVHVQRSFSWSKERYALKEDTLTTNRLTLTNDFIQQGQNINNSEETSTPIELTSSSYVDFSPESRKTDKNSGELQRREVSVETSSILRLDLSQKFNKIMVEAANNEIRGSLLTEDHLVNNGRAATTSSSGLSHRWLPAANLKMPGHFVRLKSTKSSPISGVNYRNNNIKSLPKTPSRFPIFSSLENQWLFKNVAKLAFRETDNIVNGIYWTEEVERLIPDGFVKNIDSWRWFVNKTKIAKISKGCGRMQNRLITFDNGKQSCCRYRQNNDQIQGEIFSFYLSRLLNIGNLPPSVLAVIRGREWQWEHVQSQLYLAQWNNERPLVLTMFVDKLIPAYIPRAFRTKDRRLHPEDLFNKTLVELVELAQWSDLIVFDYLTANLDRVVNNMFNEQWNSEMMNSPTHNLAKHKESGLLVFFDNESGLLHGYRLLDKYEHFHRSLINSLCVFRKRTADAIAKMHRTKNISVILKQAFVKHDPGMNDWLPFLPERSLKILKTRIDTVYSQIRQCEARFSREG
ncbi:four-jointed box protein 1-like [Tachypleus tridentatus]|uniref:four-jointed box protein 1-like n=1 Tax=Tachypleus tridentatus TaxID=6853 RepID=UPI003FD66382